ncbi:hydrogenase expression/formation protein HypE [Almyronema epifaneia]|uniref:Hydrogenase expression/formation protein HypE n=1 Tax=Almyronema epifaneia S1 TaxID=2991925 RepID=A0ABW6IJ15_9CYAN
MMNFRLTCPIPLEHYPTVQLAHGGGGRLMHQLIHQMFLATFGAERSHDAAVLPIPTAKAAFTTDSYVVQPLFFPGGDIGSLAVHGTVNDLAMSGARPLYLSAGFILEEGLPMTTLWQVVQSMQQAAQQAGVAIVTGDTKVVDRGKGDGLYINTAGVGLIEHDQDIAADALEPGDVVLLSGDIGRHGIAIMAVREGLAFETAIASDSAPVSAPILDLLQADIPLHCLRDLTRGGLASALNEIASEAKMAIAIEETAIPVREDVQGACEILGFDPLYVANEGRFIAFVPAAAAAAALAILQTYHPQACAIGQVTGKSTRSLGRVTLNSQIGAARILDLLSGEQLPRIC